MATTPNPQSTAPIGGRRPASARAREGDHPKADATYRIAGLVIEFFWVMVLFVLALYAFFAIFGAYDWVSPLAIGIVIAALVLTVLARVIAGERRKGPRDARLAAARERRGF
jgi:hypothetical protein